MNLSDLLRLLQPGDEEAAAYLNDPNSRPEIARAGRAPMYPPPPQATLAPNGMRLPLPRLQGGAPPLQPQRIVAYQRPQYPLVYGPGAGAGANPVNMQPPAMPPVTQAPVMRFRDAAAPLGPEMVQEAPPIDNEPWRQPAPTPMYQGGGVYGGMSDRGWQEGAAAMRRGVEPKDGFERPPGYLTEDQEWNAALQRVRETLNFERLNTESRKAPTLPRQGNPLIAHAFSRRAR